MNVSLNASPRMLSRLVTALVCLTMLGTGCSQQKVAPPQQESDRRALAADSLHMARLYAQWQQEVRAQGKAGRENGNAQQMPIDLADDAQFSFLKNRLRAAGNTPENSPYLFSRLEKARNSKKSGIPDATPRKDRLTGTDTPVPLENSWCGHLLPLSDVATSDSAVARFEASGLVTCFNGSDYAYTDVTAFATNPEHTQFHVLGSQSLEEYAGAVLETPPLDLDMKVDPGQLLFVDSVAMAFNESTGETHFSYAVAESSVVSLGMHDVNMMEIEHPKELIGRQYQDNPIRTCLERGAVVGSLDCDYTSGSKDPVTGAFIPFGKPYTGIAAVDPEASLPAYAWKAQHGDYWEPAGGYDTSHLYLPMRGIYSVTLPSSCTIDALSSDVTLVLMERGGRCTAGTAPGTSVLKGSMPFKTPYMDDWDWSLLHVPIDGLLDFGQDCLNPYQNVRMMMRSTLKATCVDNYTGQTRPYIRSRYQDIVNLDFRNACLAEGTQVMRADGKAVTVEKVKLGDKLLANDKGLALTVTAVSRGGERKPLVKLRDDHGGEVRVTETHPMVTAKRGVVQAGELKPGDTLLTRTGTVTVVALERVPYSGEVYNFSLGTAEELASLGPDARTMYANGYLVGDSHMQTSLEKQHVVDARDVLTRLNGAWHEDFRLHQARHARR